MSPVVKFKRLRLLELPLALQPPCPVKHAKGAMQEVK